MENLTYIYKYQNADTEYSVQKVLGSFPYKLFAIWVVIFPMQKLPIKEYSNMLNHNPSIKIFDVTFPVCKSITLLKVARHEHNFFFWRN